MSMRIPFAVASALVCSVFITAPEVYGQTAGDSADSEKVTPAEVTVTGSRIRRTSGFDSPVPIAVVTGKELMDSGFTVLGDALGSVTSAGNSTSLQNTSGTLFNSGESRIDLRGLDSARTLVLVDGRRHLTGNFRSSAVDLNMIPSTMIDRVEAISGGASAVYGSEAIAGVVNIILLKKYDGILLDFQGGTSAEDDGEEYKASIGYGTSFADNRVNFLIGAEYGKVEPVMQIDRDWAFPGFRRNNLVNPQTVVPANRTNTMPTATFQLVGAPASTANQRSVSIALDRGAVIANSANCRSATVTALCQDEHLFYGTTYNALQGGVDRLTARGYLSFDVTDTMQVYADLAYAKVDGFGYFQPTFSNAGGGGLLPAVMRGDNAYLNGTTALATQLRGFWQGAGLALNQSSVVNVGKFWQEFGNRDTEIFRESYRSVIGLGGGFDLLDRKVDYNVYGQYSELDGWALGYNVPNVQRLLQSTDAVTLGGQIVCRDAGARAAGCVPWDLLAGPSPEAVAWSNANARSDGLASQTVVGADFSTNLIDLPAGPLGAAVGIEYRKEKSDQIQDALSASGALFYNTIGRTKGEFDLTEGYAEIAIPLLKDLPFVHRLSIEAAGRTGDYSSVGNVNQWRVGGEYAPVQDFRLRASTSVAVRAPNITELYGPQAQNFTTLANDPCDRAQIAGIPAGDTARRATRIANCAAAIPGYDPANFQSNFGTGRSSLALLQGGNPDLEEEAADTFTVGFVVQPRWVENLQVSLDYWSIKIDDAVSTIPINTLLQNLCYDAVQATPNSSRFCGFINRDQTGATTGGLVGGVTNVVLTNQNVQGIDTNGFDASIQFKQDFGALGEGGIVLDATKTTRWDLEGTPGAPVTHYAGVLPGVNGAVPKYRANGSLSWTVRQFSGSWTTTYMSSMALSETLASTALAPFYTGRYFQHSLRANYQLNEQLVLRLGIINLTDKDPPLLPESYLASAVGSSVYDNRGRFFFLGGNYSFE